MGLRDVRDYKTGAGGSPELGTSSPFNIKVASLTLRAFTRDEVAELCGQHTLDTGQHFEPACIDEVFDATQGQPWLVNALAREMVEVVVTDRSVAVTRDAAVAARERVIVRRDTHLDSLAERLREDRVRGVMEPLLAGDYPGNIPEDDLRYVEDLGLVRRQDGRGSIVVANPIYREVIPRELSEAPARFLPKEPASSWLGADGTLDEEKLLAAFVSFWRQHGEPLMKSAPYHEIAPHLVLMAFLHRVANGGGSIVREYAIGAGRMDLLLTHGATRLAIEITVWRDGKPDPREEGLVQVERYLAGLGLSRGWLVVFDQRRGRAPIETRTVTERASTTTGRPVSIVRA